MIVFFELRRFLIVWVSRLEIGLRPSTGVRGFAYFPVIFHSHRAIRGLRNCDGRAIEARKTLQFCLD